MQADTEDPAPARTAQQLEGAGNTAVDTGRVSFKAA